MNVRRVSLSSFLIFFIPFSLLAQFKIEPKESLFGFGEEKELEYYSPLRYNRCEGLVPAFGLTWNPKSPPGLSLSFDLGYALESERWRYNAKAEYKLGFANLKFGGRYFHDTFTNDNWIISSLENSFAAILLHEDYLDFFDGKGFELWVSKGFEEWLHLRLSFQQIDYDHLPVVTDWSLFGKGKTFRDNPRVIAGREKKLRLEFIYDKLDNPIFPLSGPYIEGAIESAPDMVGNTFRHFGIFLTGKYFIPSLANQRMVFLARYGHRNDNTVAPQHLLDLGGIGTLRGYRYKEFKDGHNLLFASYQYYFGGDLLQKLPLHRLPFYSSLGLIVFVEAGALWENSKTAIPSSALTDHPEWKWDAGFSLAVTGDILRVDFAKRMDYSGAPWTVTFRVLSRW